MRTPSPAAELQHRLDQILSGSDTLTRGEALALFHTPETSTEADLIRNAGLALSRRAAQGRGQVFAQIGIDARACPGDCQYCTFAASSTALEARDELSVEQTVAYAQTFAAAGVHLISLMITAAYDFDFYLHIVATVREAVGPDTPLLANASDITTTQARQLKAAGANAAYHAVRLGEGAITSIDPTQRQRTIANIGAAGLHLMTGVEPLYEEQSAQEVVDRMLETLEMQPLNSGVCSLVPIAGTPLANLHPPTPKRRKLIGALYRLLAGTAIPFGLGGINWVDAGTNPRGRHLSKNPAELTAQVAAQKLQLEREGWVVPSQPLCEWF